MIGIVIVSYRSDDLTVRFIREELSKVSLPYRIVVVDNGADETEASALAARIPEAVVLPAENKGFAAGNNLGVRWLVEHVRPDYILLTNNDIHFRSDHLVETLCETAAAHPEAGAVGPEILGPDSRRQGPYRYQGLWDRFVWMYLSTPFLSREAKRRRFGLDYPEKAEAGIHDVLSAAFLLVDPDAFLRAGLFDEGTFLYAEENILSDRMGRIGKGFYYEPAVTVLHEHGKTIGREHDGKNRAMMQFDSMAWYYYRYRGCSRLSVRLARMLFSLINRLK
jgi:GT2 family glycosyltransferase